MGISLIATKLYTCPLCGVKTPHPGSHATKHRLKPLKTADSRRDHNRRRRRSARLSGYDVI